MLDLAKIQAAAQSYSAQELIAALVWQRKFNEFNGQEVIIDLAKNPELWASFVFSKPIFAPDGDGLSFVGLVEILLAMANYRIMAQHRDVSAFIYHADTLFILTENRDSIVSRLLDFGKKWQADSVEIIDGREEVSDGILQRRLRSRLAGELFDQEKPQTRDAVVISYWWD